MGAKINRLFDSILHQTYRNLQIVIVNDGSTDNSETIIKHYICLFKNEGFSAEYVYRENGGLGAAINTGLKYIKGDYFCWPDADDSLTPDSVEKKIVFLESNKEYAFVRSDAAVFFEDNLTKQIGFISRKSPNRFKETDLMEDYILENNIIFCPGCHMVRTSAFKEVNPKMDIYEGRRGQNYQILLPLLYKFKFGFIDECLYNYIVYSNSMSRGDDTFDKCVIRFDGLQACIIETLKHMNMDEKDFIKYSNLTYQKYIYAKACKAYDFALREKYLFYRKQLTQERFVCKLRYIDNIVNIPYSFELHRLMLRLKNKLKAIRIIYRLFRKG